MSKETLVFVLGILVFFTSFLGLPTEYKEWILIATGIILMIVGYRLRRNAFLKSLEQAGGERRADAFVESGLMQREPIPTHKDSEHVI